MRRTWLIPAALALCAAAPRPMQFWNLTSATITHLQLAPFGTQGWGPDQCRNDPDGAVDADERLPLKGVPPGRYAVRLTEKGGRQCVLPDVTVKEGGHYAFSIADTDLKDCTGP